MVITQRVQFILCLALRPFSQNQPNQCCTLFVLSVRNNGFSHYTFQKELSGPNQSHSEMNRNGQTKASPSTMEQMEDDAKAFHGSHILLVARTVNFAAATKKKIKEIYPIFIESRNVILRLA